MKVKIEMAVYAGRRKNEAAGIENKGIRSELRLHTDGRRYH